METSTLLNIMLALWILGWTAILFSVYLWSELSEMKSDKNRISLLVREKAQLKARIESMERAMMKNGYRPPFR